MQKKLKLITLTLILALLFGTLPSFAAATYAEPIDPNDPTLTVMYEKNNKSGKYTMTFKSEDKKSGTLNIDGTLYDISATYTLKSMPAGDEVWFTDSEFYQGHVISTTSPGAIAGDIKPETSEYTVQYELVPLAKMDGFPASYEMDEENHVDVTGNIETYIVNGKETDKATYVRCKNGSTWQEKVKTSRDENMTLVKETTTFTGTKMVKVGDVSIPVYAFVKDRYYESKDLTIYTLDVEIGKASLSLKAGKSKIKASWKNVPGAIGYQVQISRSKKFSAAKKYNTTSLSKNITKLASGKKYYVRVRAYAGNKCGKWSKAKSAKTK